MKQIVAWTIAYVLAGLSAALAARYGFKGADMDFDAWLRALSLGAIAVIAAHSQGWAYRIWHSHSRAIGVFSVTGVLCFLVTLAGGTGTMAGSGDKKMGARANAVSAKADLEVERDDLVDERKRLANARPPEMVRPLIEAARAHDRFKSSDGCTAERITREDTKAHCVAFRGLEAELGAAARVVAIDKRLGEVRSNLSKSADVVDADPMGTALARIAAFAVTISVGTVLAVYNLAVSCALELGAMIAMLVAEMTKKEEEEAAAVAAAAPPAPATDVTMPEALQLEPPTPTGKVSKFVLECLVPTPGAEIERADLYAAYVRWCRSRELHPISFERFATAFATICASRFQIRGDGGKVYALDLAVTV